MYCKDVRLGSWEQSPSSSGANDVLNYFIISTVGARWKNREHLTLHPVFWTFMRSAATSATINNLCCRRCDGSGNGLYGLRYLDDKKPLRTLLTDLGEDVDSLVRREVQ